MIYHVLNGDALKERFFATGLDGMVVVVRECLIEGDLGGNTLSRFFQTRAAYMASAYHEDQAKYFEEVTSEFKKLLNAPGRSEFNLWFGYDLFCQANLWFILYLLDSIPIEKQIFIVYPSYLKDGDIWRDFGEAMVNDLKYCFKERLLLSPADLALGNELWTAFKDHDLFRLDELSKQKNTCFPYLKEVCLAHIDRFPKNEGKGRPERLIEEIVSAGEKNFYSVFNEFFRRAGVYGFSDLQVRQIYDKVIANR